MRTDRSLPHQRVLSILLLFGAVALLSEPLRAQEPSPGDSLVSVELRDGTTVRGRIVQQDEAMIVLVTLGGVEMRIPRASIVSIGAIRGRVVGGTFQRYDPNYSRLLFAPTGRPLRQGEGYFSDFWVFFPSVAYGVTDNLSVMGGMSFIPGLSLTEQLYYVAPRIGGHVAEDVALSAGAIYTSILEPDVDVAAGIAFAVGTVGSKDRSFTVGVGFGYLKEEGADFEFSEHPIIVLGGNVRLSNNLALVSENWIITGADFDLALQPFSVGLRFFGERLAVDLALLLMGEVLKEGFPIPLLSFTYNFGR